MTMKSMMKTLVVCAMTLVLGVGYATAAAAEKKAGEKKAPVAKVETVVGKVEVTKETKDAKEVVTAIKIKAEKGVYNVALDAKGKELATMAGKEVQAKGTVAEKNGVKTLTITECKEVAAKPAPAPAPKKEEPKK
jgi:hypothetical protein